MMFKSIIIFLNVEIIFHIFFAMVVLLYERNFNNYLIKLWKLFKCSNFSYKDSRDYVWFYKVTYELYQL